MESTPKPVSPPSDLPVPEGTARELPQASDTHSPAVVARDSSPTLSLNFLTPPEAHDELGRLGGYRVLKLLGEGGMGSVFLAEDLLLQRRVALKVMRPDIAAQPLAQERFLRESRSAAALKSDHVITIHQVGQGNGVAFLAMELLEGATLEDYLKSRQGHPGERAVLKVAADVLRGLAVAHAKGLIHRDIKPANLWIEAGTQRVKILDFGLTRSAQKEEQLTLSGAVVGTPSYMAPEQAHGHPIDGRADLFSLGVVLYRMVAGKSPFQRGTVMATLLALAQEDPPPLKGVSPAVAEFVLSLMKKKPDERPASAQVALTQLRELDRKLVSAATAAMTPPPALAVPEATPVEPPTVRREEFDFDEPSQTAVVAPPSAKQPKADQPATSKRLLFGLLGLLLVGVGGFIVIKITNKDGTITELKLPDDGVTKVEVEQGGKTVGVVDLKGKEKKEVSKKEEPKAVAEGKIDFAAERKIAERISKIGKGTQVYLAKEDGSRIDWKHLGDGVYTIPDEPFYITELKFAGSEVTDDDLLRCAGCRNLTALSLEGVDAVTPRGLNAFREFQGLKTLRVWGKLIGEPTELLKANPLLENLGVQIDNPQVLKSCPRLRYFSVNGGAIEEQIRILPEACPDLREVWVGHIHPKLLRPLGQLKRLRKFHIDHDPTWDPDLAKALAGAPHLESISCRANNLKSLLNTLKPLGGQLRQLRVIGLGEIQKAPLVPEDLAPFTELTTLQATYFSPSDADLLQIGTLPRLSQFELGEPDFRKPDHPLTDAGVDAFRRLRPDVGARIGWVERTRFIAAAIDWPGKLEGSKSVAPWPKATPPPPVMPFTPEEAAKHQEAWAKQIKQPVEIENKLGMKFRLIPLSEAEIDTPAGRVLQRQEKPYYLGSTEVTVGQFKKFVEATAYKTEAEERGNARNLEFQADPKSNWRNPGYEIADSLPVNVLSLKDMQAFCDWLGKQDDAVYRLPTESEWEFAARGGSNLDFGFAGPTAETVSGFAWTRESPKGEVPFFHPVGQKKPNPFGLFDVLGNVWELTANPTGVVLRGGGGNDSIDLMKDFCRHVFINDIQPNVGFRVLRQTSKEPLAKLGEKPVFIQRNSALTSHSAVSRPTPIPGVRSWTIELIGYGGMGWGLSWKGDRIITSHAIWNADGTFKAKLPYAGHIESLAVTHDGSKLLTVEGGDQGNSVHLWDLTSGKDLGRFSPNHGIAAVFTSPTENRALLCTNNGFSLWTPGSNTFEFVETKIPGIRHPSVGWSSDGKRVVVQGPKPGVWDIETKKKVAELVHPERKEDYRADFRVSFTGDGKWVVVTRENAFDLWDAKTFAFVKSVEMKGLWHVNFHPTLPRVVSNGEGGLQVFDLESEKRVCLLQDVPHHQQYFRLDWSPKGDKLVLTCDSGMIIYDAVTGKRLPSAPVRGMSSKGVVPSPDASRFAVRDSARKERLIFDTETGEPTAEEPGPHGAFVAFGSGKTTRLYAKWQDAKLVFTVINDEGNAVPLKMSFEDNDLINRWWGFTSDGKWVTVASSKSIYVYSTRDGSEHARFEHPGEVNVLRYGISPDGKRIASNQQGSREARIWDIASGKLLHTWKHPSLGNESGVSSMSWDPNGRDVWVGSYDGFARLDTETGRFGKFEPVWHANWNLGLDVASDGEKLLHMITSHGPVYRDTDGTVHSGKGSWAMWHPDARRFLAWSGWGAIGYDTRRKEQLGVCFPEIQDGNHWLVVGPEGHYRGSKGVEEQFVYIAQLDDGTHVTLTPKEFAEKFKWKNDPAKARLMKLE